MGATGMNSASVNEQLFAAGTSRIHSRIRISYYKSLITRVSEDKVSNILSAM